MTSALMTSNGVELNELDSIYYTSRTSAKKTVGFVAVLA